MTPTSTYLAQGQLTPGRTPPLTARRETDAHTALTRGLAEYLQSLSIEWTDGPLSLADAVYDHAEFENANIYPRAAVYASGEGTYDGSHLAQMVPRETLPNGLYPISTDELVLDITVELWAQSKVQRTGIAAMLEDGLRPIPDSPGFKLILPHYYGCNSEYVAKRMTYSFSDDEAQANVWKATCVVWARVPVIRTAKLGIAQTRANVAALAPGDLPPLPSTAHNGISRGSVG